MLHTRPQQSQQMWAVASGDLQTCASSLCLAEQSQNVPTRAVHGAEADVPLPGAQESWSHGMAWEGRDSSATGRDTFC